MPERLYYPLDKAAKKINCDVSDIIHLAANGYISLCFKFIFDSIHDSDFPFELYFPVDEDKLDEFILSEKVSGDLDIDNSFINSYFSCRVSLRVNADSGKLKKYNITAKSYMGLIEIGPTDIYRNEDSLLNEENVRVGWMLTPRDHHASAKGFFDESDFYTRDSYPFFPSEFINHFYISVNQGVKDYPSVNINDLVITQTEMHRIMNEVENPKEIEESPKTASLKGEIIRPLIQMIPEFEKIDIDSMPVAKVKDMVEAIAAERGIEFPEVYRATWQKYLGRNRMVK